MMRSQKVIKDERVLTEMHKTYSNAFSLVFFMLLASLFIKSIILDMPFKSYLSEFIIFLVGSVFVVIQGLIKGTFDAEEKVIKIPAYRTKMIIFAVVGGIIFSFIIGFGNLIKYQFDIKMIPVVIIPLFIEYTLITLVISWGLSSVSRKLNEKRLKKMNDEDNLED